MKIDQSFIRDLTTDPDDASITAAIISMARALSLRVVAEGVETEEQLTFLRTHGCDEMQGYLFSPPVPAEQATELLRETPPVDPVAWAAGLVIDLGRNGRHLVVRAPRCGMLARRISRSSDDASSPAPGCLQLPMTRLAGSQRHRATHSQ